MKHLLIGAAVVAALAISAPAGAQTAASTGTNAAAPAAPAGHTGSVTRAHHRRHAVHAAKNPSAGTPADQLNQQEVAKFQANNPASMNRMPAGGKPTSGNTTQ